MLDIIIEGGRLRAKDTNETLCEFSPSSYGASCTPCVAFGKLHKFLILIELAFVEVSRETKISEVHYLLITISNTVTWGSFHKAVVPNGAASHWPADFANNIPANA